MVQLFFYKQLNPKTVQNIINLPQILKYFQKDAEYLSYISRLIVFSVLQKLSCSYTIFIIIYFLISTASSNMASYNLTRSFVLEKQLTQETQIIKGEVTIINGYANLDGILSQIGNPELYRFKIYDFSENKYNHVKDYCVENQDLEKGYFVPSSLLRTDIVLIKYILDESQTSSIKSGSQSASDTSSIKKQRSKERTIAEVIEIVKQWRQMHTNATNGKKINLQEAAEMIGISKKSLDDYYYQLRLGQKYDFDFAMHMDDKVGVLRTFIKDIKPTKKDSRTQVQKHPKKLKIIQQDLGIQRKPTKSSRSKRSKKSQSHSLDQEDPVQAIQNIDMMQQEQTSKVEDLNRNQINSIQNQFYNQFQFLGQEPLDPFLNFECDFKKKSFDDISGEHFF